MKAVKGITILIVALIFTSEAVFSSEARHLATRKYKLTTCKLNRSVTTREATLKEIKAEVVNHREIISTTEDVRPSMPGHSPGVGHKLRN